MDTAEWHKRWRRERLIGVEGVFEVNAHRPHAADSSTRRIPAGFEKTGPTVPHRDVILRLNGVDAALSRVESLRVKKRDRRWGGQSTVRFDRVEMCR